MCMLFWVVGTLLKVFRILGDLLYLLGMNFYHNIQSIIDCIAGLSDL